jgi:homopolymeric O-antigen transport system ATP-binding protein
MADDFVIRAERISKKYIIGHEADGGRHGTFRDVISHAARGFGRSLADMMNGRAIVAGDSVEEFWALKDVSFEVRRGEVVGIIGRNGAGKSTLLKILSRITDPSEGYAEITGRVASLLEVGTGFHPELTGRENIFLNGAILGMNRVEIRKKFDEIVSFSGVERFLDTPIKRYSSGMYVRLAFAVAAHLEPQILIVDEVLSVGDLEFQKKCLGKISEVASGGRTVLFVSHNLSAVRRLCSLAFLLDHGRLIFSGEVAAVISRYVGNTGELESGVFELVGRNRQGSDQVRVERLSFANHLARASLQVFDDIDLTFHLSAENPRDMIDASPWILFRNMTGDDVMMIMQKDSAERLPASSSIEVSLSTKNILSPGRYSIACGVFGHGKEIWDWVDNAGFLDVEADIKGLGSYDSRLGMVTVEAEWRISHQRIPQ